MDEVTDRPAPPEDLPEAISAALREASVHDLRETVMYAQELLRNMDEPTAQIEPRPGEEIVEVSEENDRLIVVKRQPCSEGCPDCPHGPYVYEVAREKRPSGETHFHWEFLGRKVEAE